MSRRFLPMLVLLALSVLCASAFQWTNEKKSKPRDRSVRNLIGVVTMPDDTPANGAVVKLKNMKTLQVRSFITQQDGKYEFQNLSASIDFEVKADFKTYSSAKRTLTIFDTRLDPVINLHLEAAKAQEAPPKAN